MPARKARESSFALRLVAGIAIAIIAELVVSGVLVGRYIGRQKVLHAAQLTPEQHKGAVASLAQLKGSGRIYLLQVEPHSAPYTVDELAEWLKSKYKLDVQVLPPMAFDQASWDSSRKQYVAERLDLSINRAHPELIADPNAYLIGFTDSDMYPVQYSWPFAFSMRYHGHTAVISSFRMQDTGAARLGSTDQAANEHLKQRLRRTRCPPALECAAELQNRMVLLFRFGLRPVSRCASISIL